MKSLNRTRIIPYSDAYTVYELVGSLLGRGIQFAVCPDPADQKNELRTGWSVTWPEPHTFVAPKGKAA